MDERSAKLLLKAVRTLPQRDQDAVLAALLRDHVASPGTVIGPPMRPPGPPDVVMLSEAPSMLLPPGIGSPGPTAMLPVRLPPELHDQLRRWSTDHGFSMAGVVRGLVERFLDQQARASTARPAAGSARKPKASTPRGRAKATPRTKRARPTARG